MSMRGRCSSSRRFGGVKLARAALGERQSNAQLGRLVPPLEERQRTPAHGQHYLHDGQAHHQHDVTAQDVPHVTF